MKEAYCSFEIAKLLKQKGFEHNGRVFYNEHGVKYCVDAMPNSLYDEITDVIAPTLQMACAWLREEKSIAILPEIHTTKNSAEYYWAALICSLKRPFEMIHWVSAISSDANSGYNDAIESALKYVLKKLI